MNDEPLRPDQLRAWLAFLRATHLLDQKIERQLKDDGGLSHAGFEILVQLELAGGSLRMAELARVCVISKSRLTYQVSALEGTGLVRRRPSLSDGRVIHTELTDAGRTALRRVRPGHRALVKDAFISLLSDADLERLAVACEAMIQRLDPD